MKVTITIDTDNAAFDPENDGPEQELARILTDYARELANGTLRARKLYDINGDPVGSVEITEDEEPFSAVLPRAASSAELATCSRLVAVEFDGVIFLADHDTRKK